MNASRGVEVKRSIANCNFQDITLPRFVRTDKPCTLIFRALQNFSHVFTSFGNCWTFNSGTTGPILKETFSGSGNGLQMLIDIQQVFSLSLSSAFLPPHFPPSLQSPSAPSSDPPHYFHPSLHFLFIPVSFYGLNILYETNIPE